MYAVIFGVAFVSNEATATVFIPVLEAKCNKNTADISSTIYAFSMSRFDFSSLLSSWSWYFRLISIRLHSSVRFSSSPAFYPFQIFSNVLFTSVWPQASVDFSLSSSSVHFSSSSSVLFILVHFCLAVHRVSLRQTFVNFNWFALGCSSRGSSSNFCSLHKSVCSIRVVLELDLFWPCFRYPCEFNEISQTGRFPKLFRLDKSQAKPFRSYLDIVAQMNPDCS